METPDRPPAMKYHHKCIASKRLYTYNTIDVPSGPRTRRAAEERRIQISTPAERRPAMVENSRPGADSKQGESTLGRGRRGREIYECWKKGVYPSLYRPRGVPYSPLPHVGLNPQGGECAGQGGWAPPLGAKPKGGNPLLP